MDVTRSEVEAYLADLFAAVKAGRYQISHRDSNLEIFQNYIFSENNAKEVILSLIFSDFCKAVKNKHKKYAEGILYIFGKEIKVIPRFEENMITLPLYLKFNKLDDNYVFVVSFHKQQYPLQYKFK